MRSRIIFSLVAILAAALACNSPNITINVPGPTEPPVIPGGGGIPTSAPSEIPVFTAGPTDSYLPPTPTNTLLPENTPTSSAPTVQAGTQDVNCRYGPATAYLAVGYLLKGYVAPILGKSEDGAWWYIQDPRQPGIYCFVAQNVTNSSGETSSIPTIPTPETRVIAVNIEAEVPSPVSCAGGFPVSIGFDASIETNGPGLVTWRWEISDGTPSASTTLMFLVFGTQPVVDSHNIGAAGNYWVRLHVLSPNDIYDQANYVVTCTP